MSESSREAIASRKARVANTEKATRELVATVQDAKQAANRLRAAIEEFDRARGKS